jgi:hypothetical protein
MSPRSPHPEVMVDTDQVALRLFEACAD